MCWQGIGSLVHGAWRLKLDISFNLRSSGGSERYTIHAARHWADTLADCGEETDFEFINSLVELVNLLINGCLGIILFRDRGIGPGLDLFTFQWLGHAERCGSPESSVM